MAVDRGAIDAQLREIGEGERWWEQREFRALPHILHEEERILGMVIGKVLGARRPRVTRAGRWLLVATSQRLICLKQERFARKQIEFPAGQISRVLQSSRLRSFQISIQTPRGSYRLRIPKDEAFRFTGALAPLMPEPAAIRSSPLPEALGWLPGASAVASLPGISGMVSRVTMLATPEYATRAQVERLAATVEGLQGDVERLRQQVGFLEDLLETRAGGALPPASLRESA